MVVICVLFNSVYNSGLVCLSTSWFCMELAPLYTTSLQVVHHSLTTPGRVAPRPRRPSSTRRAGRLSLAGSGPRAGTAIGSSTLGAQPGQLGQLVLWNHLSECSCIFRFRNLHNKLSFNIIHSNHNMCRYIIKS